MTLNANKLSRALSALALTVGTAAVPFAASAQQAAPAGPAPGQWYKTCAKQGENDLCVVQNVQLAQNGQLITAVGMMTLQGKETRKIMQVSVPTARLLPPGITMQIDGGKGQKMDYTVCLPDKCIAEAPLTDANLAALKKGTEVVFTSVNFRRAPNPIKITLSGFTGVYDGPAISESQVAESQRSLQEGMQKKAEETRKKLEDAQNAAKQGQ
ncbi:invasion associated locus B family protein [Rhizobiales bacterium RZME27]|jgi:invasion protein IalB|uniref:Invasion associated locus B family protein n=1 Tax=Endobacterium cereale TaxID=2663029 RepID=A0A6A8A1V0_9HYPH|nr:invasion associated locus B family protein [Endobacterium cereale]MEB2843440.1 invasion associated locus B family protein [Endobacterium cereale]MQY44559.1 invasion associated locus B family protein [Endobacterium cereale]